MSWVTPISPMRPDEMWEVFRSHEAGIYEWLCGFGIAHELLNGGMTHINGTACTVRVVDERPELGGIHLRATLEQHREQPAALAEAA